MGHNSNDSLEENMKSMSTDSLETLSESNNSSDSSSNNLIPFYLGEVAKKYVLHLSKNVKNNEQHDKDKPKKCNYATSIHHSTCHLDKSMKNKIGLQRCLGILEQKKKATKTYLEIFTKRMQLKDEKKIGKVDIDTSRSVCGDLTPPKLSEEDLTVTNDTEDWDSSSFYIKILEDNAQLNFKNFEVEEKNNNHDNTDSSIQSIKTHTELHSVSNGPVLTKNQPVLKNINPRMVSPKLNGFGSNFNSVRKKLELFEKQREYGQNCSNKNRVKIIQNQSKSQTCIVAKELSIKEIKKLPECSNRTKLSPILPNKLKNSAIFPRIKSNYNILNNSPKTFTANSNQSFKGAQHKKTMIGLLQRDVLKNLQDRHESDQKLIHKLRNIDADNKIVIK